MYLVETDRAAVPIEDLKLVARAGIPLWITWEQKRASTCLRRLEAIGHVRVSPGDRARKENPPAPGRPKAQQVRLSRPSQKSPAPAPPAPTYTQEQVDAMVKKAAKEASAQTAAAFLDQLKEVLPSASPAPESRAPTELGGSEDLEARVEAAVGRALSKATLAPQSPSTGDKKDTSSGPDEPIFIPEGIVSAEDQTELTLQSDSSEDGVEDAAAALKKLRRKKES